MKHGLEHNSKVQAAPSARPADIVVFFAMAALVMLALGICCVALVSIERTTVIGALRAWYLPLAVLLVAVRAGSRRGARRALSLALVLLGIGALVARALDARASSDAAPPHAALAGD